MIDLGSRWVPWLLLLLGAVSTPGPRQSEEDYAEVVFAAQEAGDASAEGRAVYDLANFLCREGRLEEAYDLLREGTETSHPHLPYFYLRLAAIARARDLWGDARQWLDLAASVKDAPRTPSSFAFYLHGECFRYHLSLGLLDLAAMDLDEEERRAADLGENAHARATLVQHRLEYLLAIDDHERVVEIADELLSDPLHPDFVGQIGKLRAFALVETSRRDPEVRAKAVAVMEELLRIAEAGERGAPTPQDELHLELFLAMLQLEAEDHGAAERWLARAGARIEDLRRDGEENVRTRLAVLHDSLRGYHRIRSGATGEAGERALEEMRAAFDRLLAEWRSVPPRPGGIGFLWFSHKQLILEYLLRATLLVEGPEEGAARALEDLLRAQAQGSLARRLGAPESARLSEVRRSLLDPGHGLLVYLPSPERGLVFAVDRERILVADLAPRVTLLEARRAFLAEVTRSPADGAPAGMGNAASRDMAALLLPDPVRTAVREWEGITVVGLDLLGWIPFEALPFPGERPLGLERAVDALPSVPLGLHLVGREEARAAAGEFLFLGAPTPTPEARARYGIEDLSDRLRPEHLERMNRAAGRHVLRSHVGREATARRLAGGALDDVAVLHLLTHGVFDPRGAEPHTLRERPAALVLTAASAEDDGLLRCEDVEALEHMPPLVVLSACGAARGQVRQGEDGANHLGGAFLGAGAATVLLSGADLDFDATLELVTRFTEHLVGGNAPPARALQLARRDLVEAHPEWAHPYYHGLMQVVGLGRQPLRLSPAPAPAESGWKTPLAAGVVLGVLVLAWIATRRRRGGATPAPR